MNLTNATYTRDKTSPLSTSRIGVHSRPMFSDPIPAEGAVRLAAPAHHAVAAAFLSGLVILLYKLLSRRGAGGGEKGSRQAVPV